MTDIVGNETLRDLWQSVVDRRGDRPSGARHAAGAHPGISARGGLSLSLIHI